MKNISLIKYILSLILFGLNGIIANHIALSSYEIVFFRTLLASVFLLIVFIATKNKFHIKGNKKDILFITISGISMGASWMFLYEAYTQIGVSFATLLYYTGPIIVMLIAPFLFKEKLKVTVIIGFAIAIVGIFLINGELVSNNNNLWGIICGLLSAVTYSSMVLSNKKSQKIVGFENSVFQLIVSFFTLLIFIGIKQHFVIKVEASSWIWIILLGVINTGVGCYLYFSSLSKLPAKTIAICGYIEPLSAVIFSVIILKDKMTPLQIIGAVCIILGAIIGEIKLKSNTKKENS